MKKFSSKLIIFLIVGLAFMILTDTFMVDMNARVAVIGVRVEDIPFMILVGIIAVVGAAFAAMLHKRLEKEPGGEE